MKGDNGLLVGKQSSQYFIGGSIYTFALDNGGEVSKSYMQISKYSLNLFYEGSLIYASGEMNGVSGSPVNTVLVVGGSANLNNNHTELNLTISDSSKKFTNNVINFTLNISLQSGTDLIFVGNLSDKEIITSINGENYSLNVESSSSSFSAGSQYNFKVKSEGSIDTISSFLIELIYQNNVIFNE